MKESILIDCIVNHQRYFINYRVKNKEIQDIIYENVTGQ